MLMLMLPLALQMIRWQLPALQLPWVRAPLTRFEMGQLHLLREAAPLLE